MAVEYSRCIVYECGEFMHLLLRPSVLLQKEYYEMLDAPHKEFFLYEGCAHSPVYEDGEKTCEILDGILETQRQVIGRA